MLLSLAVAFFVLFGVLIHWGGRIEATLLVFGDPVFVAIDAGRQRIVLVLSLPIALVVAALATRKERAPKRNSRDAPQPHIGEQGK